MAPHVYRLTEIDPRRRRLHVRGEVHPGELAGRGYRRVEEEWVLELRRPEVPGTEADALLREFEVLRDLGYGFYEGSEWSPAELFRRYRDAGRLRGEFISIRRA